MSVSLASTPESNGLRSRLAPDPLVPDNKNRWKKQAKRRLSRKMAKKFPHARAVKPLFADARRSTEEEWPQKVAKSAKKID